MTPKTRICNRSYSGCRGTVLRLTLAATLLVPVLARAERVTCEYTYGGETKVFQLSPVASPYTVPTVQVGSYFLLRAVWQNNPAKSAAVNVYTYADSSDGPVIIHQASFPYPLTTTGRFGFSGLQRVYEPMRDGELQYWCALDTLTADSPAAPSRRASRSTSGNGSKKGTP
ncbi:MAG: hypothetical protein JWL63_2555 [Rhodocyclales bacterium]|nr:hypothetical protein [Rhodocyclales bacterium]